MKKTIALLLALVLCLSLCACGGGNDTPETTETPTSPVIEKHGWEYAKFVDEFGDEVADSNQSAIITSISGDFSNTATNSSELGGSVYVLKSVGAAATDWSVYFRLLEYGNNPITYYDKDELTLKIKVDDTIEEYTLTGVAPSGDLRLGEDKIGNNPVYDYLYDGKDVRCIIYIGNSKYNFTIESDDFVDACVDAGYVTEEKAKNDAMKVGSIRDVIDTFYLHADSTKRNDFLAEHLNDFPVVSDNELQEMMSGYWMTVTTNTWGNWDMLNFSEDGIYVYAGYQSTDGTYIAGSGNGQKLSWRVENGFLYMKDVAYQVSKLMDGYYIANVVTADDSVETIPKYLFIQSNKDGSVVYPYK